MFKKTLHMSCAASLLLAAANAQGQAVYTTGLGQMSCGEAVALTEKDGPGKYMLNQWFRGFVTGASYYTGVTSFKDVDNKSLDLFVLNYCRNNPLHTAQRAAAALVGEIGGPPPRHTYSKP